MPELYFRSFNPVWNFRTLTGLPVDDEYYAFFVQNQIPYDPQPVYHTPSGTPWSNPIQLTAAGTLPVDVFFDKSLVYRIEIRRGETKQAELVWLIEDYHPAGGSGSGPITSASITSDNQMTNPQFSIVNFDPSIVIAATNPSATPVAPGWDLVLTGTGTATVTREALNNASSNPTNAPYALRLNLAGWDTAYLRQRFNQNGMLWANKFVSTSVTARVEGANANISATMVDSNGTLLATLLPSNTLIDSNFTEKTGVQELDDTSNPNTPPNAYVEYRLNFEDTTTDIFVTSLQAVSGDTDIAFSYEQETIERQVDHTYNTAYPIIPVGAVIDFAGTSLPEHYLACNGAAVSRSTYRQLFAIIGTTWGAGDGSTTFNLPNLTDRVTAGSGGSIGGGSVGDTAGSATHTLTIAEMPTHNHPGSSGTYLIGDDAGGGVLPPAKDQFSQGTNPVTVNVAPEGDGNAHSIVQPTAIMRKIIRYQ